jgi:hypothetical protein
MAFCTLWTASLVADYDSCRGRTRIDLGYRQDNFEWSIAGTHGVPNVLSELKWQRLHMLEASLFGWHSDPYNFIPYLRWSGSYSTIMRGKVLDQDYAGHNRRCEFSRAEAKCYRGNVLDLAGGIGWPVLFEWCGWLQFAPVIGISWRQQHLHMHGGHQRIALYDPNDVGRIHGLRSEYRTHWWGPWAGLDAFWEWDIRWAFTGSFEYHWSTRYRATGDWNLRPEFCGGFHHRAQGHAWVARGGIEFAFDCYWLFSLDATVQRWHTNSGTDTTRLKVLILDDAKQPLGF